MTSIAAMSSITFVLWLAALQPPPAAARDGSPSAAPYTVVPGSEQPAVVVFVARVINTGTTAALRSPSIHMYTPLPNLPHQTLTRLEVEGRPERLTDRWGSRVLNYRRGTLPPGQTMTGRWTARATMRRLQWDLGVPREIAPALTPEERAFYLRDTADLALNDPTVREAANLAARGREGSRAILDGVFGLVMDRLSYARDGKWDKVPQVLASGKGSCSEYSYCFIALSRRQGIPARYLGGIVGRTGAPFHYDRVFHRFSEAFVPGAGWVDFDPTRTDGAGDKRQYFGRTPGPMLLLCVGDGGEGSLTGSDYLETHKWEGGPSAGSGLRQAWWFAPPAPAVEKQVAGFRKHLASAGPGRQQALVREALRIGDPFVLPWLDDLLYQPATRVEAARACLKIGGAADLGAVINTLGRLGDKEGDRDIGALLEQFTSQKLGRDRAKWNEWLKTRNPRTALPGL